MVWQSQRIRVRDWGAKREHKHVALPSLYEQPVTHIIMLPVLAGGMDCLIGDGQAWANSHHQHQYSIHNLHVAHSGGIRLWKPAVDICKLADLASSIYVESANGFFKRKRKQRFTFRKCDCLRKKSE